MLVPVIILLAVAAQALTWWAWTGALNLALEERRQPMTLNDKRIFVLALHADLNYVPTSSLEVRPDGRLPVEGSANYPWDWCDVEITANYAGIESATLLKGRTYAGAKGFVNSGDYRDAVLHVFTQLLAKLDTAAEALAMVGPRPPQAPALRAAPGKVKA